LCLASAKFYVHEFCLWMHNVQFLYTHHHQAVLLPFRLWQELLDQCIFIYTNTFCLYMLINHLSQRIDLLSRLPDYRLCNSKPLDPSLHNQRCEQNCLPCFVHCSGAIWLHFWPENSTMDKKSNTDLKIALSYKYIVGKIGCWFSKICQHTIGS
jgi:hypothetical protein